MERLVGFIERLTDMKRLVGFDEVPRCVVPVISLTV